MIAQVVVLRLKPAGSAGEELQPVMAPPLFVGVHALMTKSLVKLLAVTANIIFGAATGAVGVTVFEFAEAGLRPTLFRAFTVK